ncbi:MAG TPA: hypothetical protein PKD68_01605 [Candidatus Saccharibacteria bacterium]|nr:hypothetical protein [Candidatus Saccharibacteria bacterium]
MSKRPTVLVDMDGVLADFDGATSQYLTEKHPEIPIITERQHFYFRDDYPDAGHQAIINQLHASQYFFAGLQPIDGALEGWQRLQELGYEPIICSAPLSSNEWCVEEKLDWVERYLGRAAAKAAVFDSAKERYAGIALIDDRPVVKNTNLASWQHVLFTASYNLEVAATHRLNGWNDENLAEILATIDLQAR